VVFFGVGNYVMYKVMTRAAPADVFVSAEVTVYNRPAFRPVQPPLKIDITEAKEATRLAGFFPGVGRNPPMDLSIGLQADVIIDFKREDGKSIRVFATFDKDRTIWSETTVPGFWNVRGDFTGYVEGLLKAGKSSAVAP